MLACLFGDSGGGKSFLSYDSGCCVATGLAFHARKVEGPKPVCMLIGEGKNGVARRFEGWEIKNQVSLKDAPLFVSSGPVGICDPLQVNMLIRAIDEMAGKHGAKPRASIKI